MMKIILLLLIVIIQNIIDIECHGLLIDPPARSSAWRENPKAFPKYYFDNQMFCGGFETQWGKNKGRCGICGEDWSGPRLFEKGGKYYTGKKVRTYKENEEIEVKSEITANHEGFIEYRICNVDKIAGGEATQRCLNKMLLRDRYGRSRFRVLPNFVGVITTKLVLPKSFTCNHCVMQWRYHTANSWNTDRYTGRNCKGCGPQEEFYGCADVQVLKSRGSKSKFGREEADSSSSQEQNDSGLLIDLLNELLKLKEQKENNEKRKVEDTDGITAYLGMPYAYQKRKATNANQADIAEESDIETGDPVEDETLASRETGGSSDTIVFPDEPRPSEEFTNRGIVNFDGSSSEERSNSLIYADEARPYDEFENREEEHVGIPLEGTKNTKSGRELYLELLKRTLKRKLTDIRKK